jgi:hypothetical protein
MAYSKAKLKSNDDRGNKIIRNTGTLRYDVRQSRNPRHECLSPWKPQNLARKFQFYWYLCYLLFRTGLLKLLEKVKLLPCLIKHHAMQSWNYSSTSWHFKPSRFTPTEGTHGISWIGSRVGPTVGLDVVAKRIPSLSLPGIEPRSSIRRLVRTQRELLRVPKLLEFIDNCYSCLR